MTTQLTQLQTSVADLTTQVNNAITLLGNLSSYIKSNVDDPNALINLANELETQKTALLNAINANPVPSN